LQILPAPTSLEDPQPMSTNPSSVLVALSGGGDSALAAALLKEQGWEVRGLHFLLPAPEAKRKERRNSVRRIEERLGIPVFYVHMEDVFTKEVIAPFADAYLAGFTPNPCVVCNQVIKFDHLLQQADQQGVAFVATGHYAIVRRPENGPAELWRGVDRSKEQSYFLHRLEQRHLKRTVLPLGEMTKREARQRAAKMQLPTVSEPESQEICFIPGNDYRLFLERRKGMEIARRGNIVTKDGEKVGEHLGAYRFTIGQRHGLGIASPEPYYVMEIRPEENEVVVGRKQDLLSTMVEAKSFNWLDGPARVDRVRVFAQIRYRHIPGAGWLEKISPEEVKFEFEKPQWGITPGQALVCYDGERLLGGGWIKEAHGTRPTVHG
jgi:tRNA-specific 2-thiouridylase